jgi:hypothetical protein
VYLDLLNRPADTAGFNAFLASMEPAEQVRLLGPRGTTTPLAITDVDPVNHTVYKLTFAPQTFDGNYTLVAGPNTLGLNIKNFVDSGTPLDQNGNNIPGEYPADQYVATLPINTSDNGQFISGLYHELLGRAADAGGFLTFDGPVEAVRSQLVASLAANFVFSQENLGGFVRRLFSTGDPAATTTYLLPFGNLMRRLATQNDVDTWVGMIRKGLTEEQLLALLVSSQEYFQNRAGGSNATWVNDAYIDLLGRGITGDQVAQGFIDSLNNGTISRGQVATILVSSFEYKARLIKGVYANLLGRIASDSDINFWAPFLSQPAVLGLPTPDQRFEIAVLASQENFYRVGNTSQNWLTSIYNQLLGRTADAGGLNYNLTNLINGYQPQRAAAAFALTHSFEYKARLVTGYYLTYLHRAGTPGEITAQVNAMLAGRTDEQVIASIVSSTEYFQGLAGGKFDQWLDHIYLDLLGRQRDLGSNAFLNALNTGALTLNQVALAILTSPEYRRSLIANFYNTYLHRNKPVPPPATDGEINFWVNEMAAGLSDEDVLTVFLQSPDYYNLPHQYP